VHALELVHDLPEEAAGRGHEREDVDPQASRLVALRVLAEEADILEGDCDARSFEAVALERARELVVLADVFRPLLESTASKRHLPRASSRRACAAPETSCSCRPTASDLIEGCGRYSR
jgi:hypothetical protein